MTDTPDAPLTEYRVESYLTGTVPPPPAPFFERTWHATSVEHVMEQIAIAGDFEDETVRSVIPADYPLAAAVKDALDTLSGGGPDGFATHFTCSEAEDIARLFRAAGRADDADAWLRDHGAADDEGDSHYQGDEDTDDEDRDVPGCRKVECLVCGHVETSPTRIDMWNGYGDCLAPNDHEEQRSRWTFDGYTMEVRTDDMGNTEHAAFTFDHDPRPSEGPEPDAPVCRDCGRPVTWIGPSVATDWMHVEDPANAPA